MKNGHWKTETVFDLVQDDFNVLSEYEYAPFMKAQENNDHSLLNVPVARWMKALCIVKNHRP
jgi:hypothetical protein